jgi:hypothetical protein
MIQTAYLSSAPIPLTGEDIEHILSASRTNNHRRGITGMLLYLGGNFLQVLEGEREAIEALFDIIERDPRHHRIIRLFTHGITQRDFPDWSMGFRRFTANSVELEGFTDFFHPSFEMSSIVPSRAATLLKMFKDNNR